MFFVVMCGDDVVPWWSSGWAKQGRKSGIGYGLEKKQTSNGIWH